MRPLSLPGFVRIDAFRRRLLVAAMALTPCVALAEGVEVVTERAEADAAPAFRFKTIPAPSETDAANAATLTVLDGRRDGNAGRLGVLRDGRLPDDSDQPHANFFFGGSLGGRLLSDLGEARPIHRINTYSWHIGGRGPQVYTLYASDGDNLQLDASATSDPESVGWERIASVDTRPPAGTTFGGQHGASIARADQAPLGSFRYLLFDVSRTSPDDPFGATFFSEIDVHDGREHPAPERGAVDVLTIANEYEITFDTVDTPELQDWVDTKLKPVCAQWYPRIVEMLPSDGYRAPRRLSITFHADMDGVAHASGAGIHCAAKWFNANLEGETLGAVVHELVHVVQQYRHDRSAPNPGWLVEGVADYIRWFLYEPESQRPRPNPQRANHDDSYRTTAHFLDYVLRNHDGQIVVKLNAAMRKGEYSDNLWRQATDKTLEELGREWKASLRSGE